MITICLTYFKSLTLASLSAALHSVRQQDLSCVKRILVVDNDTDDSTKDIRATIDRVFSKGVSLSSYKHGNRLKTHAWSTNQAMREADTEWVLFTRADYLLAFDLVDKFVKVGRMEIHGDRWFITGNGYHVNVDVAGCEETQWRLRGIGELTTLPGSIVDYTDIDSGVWLTRKTTFDLVGGLDEKLTAWGHAQTDFQHRLYMNGVRFERIPFVMFCHPLHAGERDLALAHEQIAERGGDIREMWKRYQGAKPY